MGAEKTDEELMLAYAQGDARAFEALYARQRGMLYRYVLRSVGDRAMADDVYQETWSRVVASRARYRIEAKFSTWLLQIAHNLVIDSFRRAKPQAGAEETDTVMRELDAPESEQPERVLTRVRAAAAPAGRSRRAAARTTRSFPAAHRRRPRLGRDFAPHRRGTGNDEIAPALCAGEDSGEIFGMSGNEKLERELESFLAEENSRVAALYRKLPRNEPDAELDASVLAMARNAVASQRRRNRWLPAMSAAAVVLIVAGVAYRAGPQVWNDRGARTAAPPANTVDEAKTTSASPASPPAAAAPPVLEPRAAMTTNSGVNTAKPVSAPAQANARPMRWRGAK